jgi:hypothetical protein
MTENKRAKKKGREREKRENIRERGGGREREGEGGREGERERERERESKRDREREREREQEKPLSSAPLVLYLGTHDSHQRSYWATSILGGRTASRGSFGSAAATRRARWFLRNAVTVLFAT